MAAKLKNDSEPGEGDTLSVAARRDVIIKSFKEMYALRLKIAAAMEKHVAPLRADVNAIKAKLRNDYSMPAKLVSARFASYELERLAEDGDDDITLDTIREMYELLPIGGTVDLVEAAGGEPRRGKRGGAGLDKANHANGHASA